MQNELIAAQAAADEEEAQARTVWQPYSDEQQDEASSTVSAVRKHLPCPVNVTMPNSSIKALLIPRILPLQSSRRRRQGKKRSASRSSMTNKRHCREVVGHRHMIRETLPVKDGRRTHSP